MSSGSDWVLVNAGLGLAVAAFVLSWLFCALARRYALRFGFLDRPGGHKGHQAPVPLGGGVAIWLATMIVLGACGLAVLLGGPELPRPMVKHITASGLFSRAGELLEILVLATIIMVMGLIDDRKSLKWQLRLGIQVLCAAILAASGVRVTLFWPFTHPLLGGAVTVMWIVGLTNSFNMLDNMDGLAASVGLIAAGLFCVGQVAAGSLFAPAVLLIVMGALGGFLVHNHAPARLYMGDAGSNSLGFLLGAMTVVGTYHVSGVDSPFSVLAPLLVMAVPLYDTTSVVLIRLLEGRSPFQGDRRHFSHRLVARGLTPPQAVWTIDLVTLAGGLGALLLHRLDSWGAGLVMAQTACLLGVVAILELARSRPQAGHGQRQGPGEMKARA
jgi:UDP-GlcNAc:undecaprenyl-phosphate/decaprenyl-phosphate GlcNAc-1-phosphate transferase